MAGLNFSWLKVSTSCARLVRPASESSSGTSRKKRSICGSTLQRFKVLTGIVTQADTQAPVSDALIVLYPSQTTSPFEQKATSTADGRFSIETRAGPAHAFVLDKKAGLGAIAEVGAEQTAVDLPLLKLGTAHGRLLTEDGSQPAAGVKLGYAVRIKDPINTTFFNRFGGEVTTDSDGTFTLPYLVPGWDYECVCNDYPGGAMLGIAKVNVQPGESQSLGDRTKPAAPSPMCRQP